MTEEELLRYYYLLKRYYEKDLDEFGAMIDDSVGIDDFVLAMVKYRKALKKIEMIEEEAAKFLIFLVQFTIGYKFVIIIL